MVESPERRLTNTIKPAEECGDTLVIDNGIYELRAGYKNDMCIAVKNLIYKNKDRISFDPFPLASVKTMFDGDVIINFDILEHTLDMILEHTEPEQLENLIITTTPCMPTEAELVEFLFSVYKFNKIQIGTDFIYAYHKYFNGLDCLIVALKYSSIVVSYVGNERIEELYRIDFGGRNLLEYINFVMTDRYKEFRRDYRGMAASMRVSMNYNEEAVRIYKEMCSGDYRKSVFFSDAPEARPEHVVKKTKKAAHSSSSAVPSLDYGLLDADDETLNHEQLREKRKQRMLYNGALHRLKARIGRMLQGLDELLEELEEKIERQNDPASYISRKKARFERLKRALELREKLRNEAKNRKTREFQIKNKEGPLDAEEQKIRNAIADAEDEEQDEALVAQLDRLSGEILELDPEFIPYYANTVEILRGDNIGRQCVNVELIKWPEIFFYPSIIGSEEMGLAEMLEQISARRQVRNALVCGGFSYIRGMGQRIEALLNSFSVSGDVHVIVSEDSQTESFYGACFSPLYPTYTREDFERYGPTELVSKYSM